jgi:hypothetical protein
MDREHCVQDRINPYFIWSPFFVSLPGPPLSKGGIPPRVKEVVSIIVRSRKGQPCPVDTINPSYRFPGKVWTVINLYTWN